MGIIKPTVYNEICKILGEQCTLEAFSVTDFATTCPTKLQAQDFLQHQLDKELVWLHPPTEIISEALQHYINQKHKNPELSAILILPSTLKNSAKPWLKYMKGMQYLKQYQGRDSIYCDKDQKPFHTSKATEIWYDPPLIIPRPHTLSMESYLKQGKLVHKMVFDTRLHGATCTTLMDSGSNASHIDLETFNKLGLTLQKEPVNGIQVAGETTIPILGVVTPTLRIGKLIVNWQLNVVNKLMPGIGIILGEDFFLKYGVILDYPGKCCHVKSQGCSIYPITTGDVHTRYHGISLNLISSRPHTVDLGTQDILTPTQAVKALRKGHQYIAINIRECGSISHQKQQILAMQAQGKENQCPQGDDPVMSQELSKDSHMMIGPVMETLTCTAGGHIDLCMPVSGNSTQQEQGQINGWPPQFQTNSTLASPTQNNSTIQQLNNPKLPPISEVTFDILLENKMRETPESPNLVDKATLIPLLTSYQDVFQELPDGLPPDRKIPHVIRLEEGTIPPYRRNYRMSPAEIEVCREYVNDLLKKGFITPSNSPYGAPMMMIAKPSGGFRVVCDWRALNKKTIKMRFPLPRIDETLDRLKGAQIFSSCDLASGYFQIRISEEDAHKTAFTTPFGQYEFKVLGQGLVNAPSTFQSLMNRVFAPILNKFVVIYLDDILIYSKTPEEHVDHLKQVLDILKKEKLYAKMAKCEFNKTEVPFLGHIVGREGIKVNPKKIEVVQNWPVPTDVQQLRQFLGLTNYFRKFILGYSSISAPLNELTKKHTNFKEAWKENHTLIFNQLKTALTTAPVLAFPDFEKPFTIVSDASLIGTGAVLLQDERPIAYTSSKFIPAELNYTTTEQELLGVVKALKEWRCYAEGNKGLKVITDHNPLTYLSTKPTLTRRLARWYQELTSFQFEWVYQPGRTNVADPLSRSPALKSQEDPLRVTPVLAFMLTSILLATRPTSKALEKRNAPKAIMDRIFNGYSQDPMFTSSIPATWTSSEGYYTYNGKVIVPDVDTLREDIIKSFHEPPYSGHLGKAKTQELVSRTFYWPKITDSVATFVKSCHKCQTNKSTNQKPGGELQPVEIPSTFWECVTTDLITKLPPTKSGYDAIAVFVDKLSKLCIAEPCHSDINAEAFSKLFLKSVFRFHGLPRKLISDRDPRFTGHFMDEVAKALEIRQAFSTSFHPQSDGQTERMNRTLEDILRHYVSPYHDDWDEHLYMAEFAINNSHNASIGSTPFFAIYGRHPLQPLTLQVRHKLGWKVPLAQQHVESFHERVTYAKACLEQAQQRMKTQADKGRRPVTYSTGQQVLLSTKNLKFKAGGCPKFAPKFVGPFTISAIIGKYKPDSSSEYETVTAVKLDLPPLMKIHPVFHVSLIKPYYPGSTPAAPAPLIYDHDGAPLWEVEAILDVRTKTAGKRIGKGKPKTTTEYLVRWKGFDNTQDSWEPAINLTHLDALRIFLEKQQTPNVATRRNS